ncbi:unnamed protein product [Arctia plantaginis]|uniref:Epoxide hydrolase n=1 Tax=Arctia plantaginis TaxID=874455 RepID=A0A8S0Z1A6_ARCPL|nr:unnamed protein product [Arctia plantaginis]
MYSLLGIFLIGSILVREISSQLTLEDRNKVKWASSPFENDTSIRTFTIKFDQEVVADLRRRLSQKRRPFVRLEGINWEYGLNPDILDYWIDYWNNKYNFTQQEAYLNTYTHYLTNIQGLDIHFLHVKPQVTDYCKLVPMLLLHGFPGSVREFYRALPLLTAGCHNGIALEVIAPSLPGFGYSDPATIPGLGGTEIGTIMVNLMKRLGFNQFYVQGGDWGSIICSMMATLYPNVVLGYHTNLPLSFSELSFAAWWAGSVNPSNVVESSLQSRMYPFVAQMKGHLSSNDYLHMQSTKPDTLGIAMTDSPISLLTYYLMLHARGDISQFTNEELLDNLMFYWIKNRFTTAARLYAESFNVRNLREALYAKTTDVPVRTVHAQNEVIYQSEAILRLKYTNIQNATALTQYGHFLAMEAPQAFSQLVLDAIAGFEAVARGTCNKA